LQHGKKEKRQGRIAAALALIPDEDRIDEIDTAPGLTRGIQGAQSMSMMIGWNS